LLKTVGKTLRKLIRSAFFQGKLYAFRIVQIFQVAKAYIFPQGCMEYVKILKEYSYSFYQ